MQKKDHTYLCYVANMMFNKSHLDVCMVTRGHFITIKIFPRGQLGRGARARALAPSGAAHDN